MQDSNIVYIGYSKVGAVRYGQLSDLAYFRMVYEIRMVLFVCLCIEPGSYVFPC